MNQKTKRLRKFISAIIIITMITALFMPTISAQAAEVEKIEQLAANYTDLENSEFRFTNISVDGSHAEINYSIPRDCMLITVVYDGITGKMTQFANNNLSANDNYASMYFDDYGNRKFTFKAFLVDENYCPLGKSYSEDIEITNNYSSPSVYLEAEPHPDAELKDDGGSIGYNSRWSVDKNGLLTADYYFNSWLSSENELPWNEYRNSITSLKINESEYYDVQISSSMFKGLSKVKSVTIPKGIGTSEDSFSDMTSLETVNLDCNEYQGYYLSNSVKGYSFINCPNLKNFVVDDNDYYYKSVDGILYSKDGETLIKYPGAKTESTFTVPDTVTSIGAGAFADAKNLKSIVMGDNVNNIGEKAFYNCTSLSSIRLSQNISGISGKAFYNCTSLKSVILPNGLTEIYKDSFEKSAIESVNLPASLEWIYSHSEGYSFDALTNNYVAGYFADCQNLKSITVSEGNENFNSVDGVLYSKDMQTLYCYPCGRTDKSYVVPDYVNRIAHGAFSNNNSIEEVVLGSNTHSIDEYAFNKCVNLKNIDLKNASSLSYGAFLGCESLETMYIPETLTEIFNYSYEANPFGYCKNLKLFSVSENNPTFTAIDGCLYSKSGTELYAYPNARGAEYNIPSYVESINYGAFLGCTALTSVNIPELVECINGNTFAGCTSLSEITLTNKLSHIYNNAFAYCTSLSKVNLPENRDDTFYINTNAFYGCENLKSIDLPDYGINLSSGAFANTGLQSITIPGNVYLSANVFYGCYDLKSIKLEGYCRFDYGTDYMFGNFDDLTIYYSVNSDLSSRNMMNIQHKDAIKWVAYDADIYKLTGTHTFTGLKPNTEYIVGMNSGMTSEMINEYNTLYCNQLTSDSNGKIVMNYTLRYSSIYAEPFAFSSTGADISKANIEIGDVIYTDYYEYAPGNHKVTYNGNVLKEGVDYIITSDSGYHSPGIYTFSIVGTGKYYGIARAQYEVIVDKYDVDKNGVIDICDATEIQYYLAGYRTPSNLAAADANGDGDITVDDVTYLQKLLANIYD